MSQALAGQIGELRFTVEVTRKDTGKVETYDLIGKVVLDDEEENKDGPNS